MYRYTKLSLLAVAIAATGAVAYAANGGMENDALAISKAKIPLTQAVTVAEQHANGKASRAEYENSKQGWVYDVEVVSGAKVFDVRVDADKGTVIPTLRSASRPAVQCFRCVMIGHVLLVAAKVVGLAMLPKSYSPRRWYQSARPQLQQACSAPAISTRRP